MAAPHAPPRRQTANDPGAEFVPQPDAADLAIMGLWHKTALDRFASLSALLGSEHSQTRFRDLTVMD